MTATETHFSLSSTMRLKVYVKPFLAKLCNVNSNAHCMRSIVDERQAIFLLLGSHDAKTQDFGQCINMYQQERPDEEMYKRSITEIA
jgi:hypothetical protein